MAFQATIASPAFEPASTCGLFGLAGVSWAAAGVTFAPNNAINAATISAEITMYDFIISVLFQILLQDWTLLRV